LNTLVLSISGMHCDGCAETIKSLLSLEDGVATASVSYRDATARILYDPARTGPDNLAKAVERAGFTVSPAAG
jgi:copper chaperone CopZ